MLNTSGVGCVLLALNYNGMINRVLEIPDLINMSEKHPNVKKLCQNAINRTGHLEMSIGSDIKYYG
jgi:hypothetical protein